MKSDTASSTRDGVRPGASDSSGFARIAPWISTLARLILAGVVIWAGVAKMVEPTESVRAVQAYQLLPDPLEVLLGYGLPFAEVALGLLLVLGFATRFAACCTGLLMLGFIVGISSAWARGLAIDCGCFGGGGTVAPQDTAYLPEILRDTGLVVCAAWLAWRPWSRLSLDGTPGGAPAGGSAGGTTASNEEEDG